MNGTGYDISFVNGVEIGTMSVGSSVYLNVDGVAYEFIIVHQGNPYSSLYDSSCDGTWLLMSEVYKTRKWDDYYSDYQNSTIHSYLNSTFIGLFDSEVKNTIKQVKVPYCHGVSLDSYVNSGSDGLSTQIFLLSAYETGINEDIVSSTLVDGSELDLFYTGESLTACNLRIAYQNGSAYRWWLRTPLPHDMTNVWAINRDGSFGTYDCTTSRGVRPALILPSTTLFDPDTLEFIG